MERLCYYRLDRLAGQLVIDLCSAEVLVVMEAVEEEFDEKCNTYCITVRQIYSLKTERVGRKGLDKWILIKKKNTPSDIL